MSEEKKNVPALRFPDFTDPWEQRKLGDVARILGGNAWKASDYSDDGEYLVVTIANVSGEVIINDSVGNRISCDNPDVYLLNKGDILVSLTGNVGRVSKMSNIKGLLNQRVGKILPNNSDINADFLFHVLRNPNFENAMIDAGRGAAQKNIGNLDVLGYNLFVPADKAEQQQIGSVFEKLDNLISQHQHKYDTLVAVKKAMLKKMFPREGESIPEIRFAGFTDPWEQRRFADLAKTRRGLTYNPANVQKDGIRVLRSSNIDDDRFVCDNEDVFVDPSAVNIPCVHNGDILITSANGSTRLVGKHTVIKGMPDGSAVHGGFMLLASAQNPEFVNALMGAPWYAEFISLYVAGGNGAIGNLNKNDLDERIVFAPSEAEQKDIGAFFNHLDNLITLHQRKCEVLKSLKSALLGKMFVSTTE